MAKFFSVSKSHIYNLIKQGKLKTIPGKYPMKVDRQSIIDLMQK